MDRRNFIKKSSLALGGILLSNMSFSKELSLTKKFKGKIVIIGAGASGLYAADMLLQSGCEVKILEASNVMGGRIKQHASFAEKPIDLGAQWLHRNSQLLHYVQKKNCKIYRDDIEKNIRFRYNNMLNEQFPSPISNLLEKLALAKDTIDDGSFLDYLTSHRYDEQIIQFCEFMTTDAATRTKNISAKEVAKLVGKFNDRTDYQFSDTTFFEFIHRHTPVTIKNQIHYNTIVKSIDYSNSIIKIYDQNNTLYECDKVLVTVPISILKQNRIQFYPTLPIEKTNNLNAIGMDKGLKMFIKFNKKFYDYGIVNAQHSAYYIDGTKRGYLANEGLFVSLLMGGYADAFYESPDKYKEKVVSELDTYYKGMASKHLEDFYFQDWGHEPHIQGVYSYAKPGMGNHRVQAQLPVNNKLFFAGEAFHNDGYNGTVHGAMETAQKAAEQILKGI